MLPGYIIPKHYLLVADVLGFSNIVSNLNHAELDNLMSEWVDLIKHIKTETGIRDVQLISDTLFVREENSQDGLQRLLHFAQSLLEEGIQRSFPIRGAITRGNVTWGKLTYGKPVLEAHKIERSLDWIGVACSAALPLVENFWSWDLVCVYPAPMKAGMVQCVPVVVWNVPDPNELLNKSSGRGLYKDGQILPGNTSPNCKTPPSLRHIATMPAD